MDADEDFGNSLDSSVRCQHQSVERILSNRNQLPNSILDLLGLLLREVTNFAEGGKVVMSHFEEVRTRLPDLSNIRNERRVFGRSSVCRFESFCKRVKGYANSLSRVICADNLGPG